MALAQSGETTSSLPRAFMDQPSATVESHLLLTLEEISRLVSHSHDPHDTLSNIVHLIQGRFRTDVCSVYVLEKGLDELVLGATVGLDPRGVGRVRMRLDEGLTGLVAERLAPVMERDAVHHPRFKYFPEAGEDPYHSFLGVPLVEGGLLEGVLVVQTTEPREFSANEIRMLVTVASQLAPLVGEAHLLEQIVTAVHEEPMPEVLDRGPLRGAALSPGIGTGRAYVVNGLDREWQMDESPTSSVAEEKARLARALDAARAEIHRVSIHISELVGEDHGAILQAQLMILQDRTIEQDLHVCLAAGASAATALLRTQAKYVAALQKVASPLFQERVYDIKDVFRRALWHLRPGETKVGLTGEKLVLVAHEASVMELFAVDRDQLAAVVVEHGGPQSHAAILARSLGVPMVSQVDHLFGRVQQGVLLRVDGSAGQVEINPAGLTDAGPRRVTPPLSVELPPGLPRVEVNVNLLCEVAEAARQQALGIGLYRSEFLFLARRTLPSEEEQLGVYRKLLSLLPGRPVTVRTFDLRPDKLVHYANWTTSAGRPFDWRLVLTSTPMQRLFKDQVRAALRAAAAGPLRLLVPLVSSSELLDFVRDTFGRAKDELEREGLEYGRDVPLGVMIETAAAAAMAPAWMGNVDFFALGTNDLVASALGTDRDNPVGSAPDPLHPGVLYLLANVITAARKAGRRVTVCGEMAADPEGTLALVALGVDALSVPVNQLGDVRRNLSSTAPANLMALATQLTVQRSATDVRSLLRGSGCAVTSPAA